MKLSGLQVNASISNYTNFKFTRELVKKNPEINKSSENTIAKLTMIRFKLYTNKRKQLTPSRKHWRYFVERGGLEISKTNSLIQILRIFYDATWQLFRTPVLSSHINFTQTRTIHQVQTYSTWSKWEDNSSKWEDNNLMQIAGSNILTRKQCEKWLHCSSTIK